MLRFVNIAVLALSLSLALAPGARVQAQGEAAPSASAAQAPANPGAITLPVPSLTPHGVAMPSTAHPVIPQGAAQPVAQAAPHKVHRGPIDWKQDR